MLLNERPVIFIEFPKMSLRTLVTIIDCLSVLQNELAMLYNMLYGQGLIKDKTY